MGGDGVRIVLGVRLAVFPGGATVPRDHHPAQLDAGIDCGRIGRVQTDPAHVVRVRPGWERPGRHARELGQGRRWLPCLTVVLRAKKRLLGSVPA